MSKGLTKYSKTLEIPRLQVDQVFQGLFDDKHVQLQPSNFITKRLHVVFYHIVEQDAGHPPRVLPQPLLVMALQPNNQSISHLIDHRTTIPGTAKAVRYSKN